MSQGEYAEQMQRQPAPPCSTQPAAPLEAGVDSLDRVAILAPGNRPVLMPRNLPSVPPPGGPVPSGPVQGPPAKGEAHVSFVVDAQGKAVRESAVVLSTSYPEYARVVVSQLPSMRFYPAERGGCAVASRITQAFAYDITGVRVPFTVRRIERRPPPRE